MRQPDLTPLSEAETRCLAALADAVIPPSDAHGVPGAGDPAIVAEIVGDAARRRPRLLAALKAVDALAQDKAGAPFADLGPDDRTAVAAAFRAAEPALAEIVANLAAQCFYRDDRVMRSLGLAPRPPHPDGYEVPEGNWSLLDPVRRRDSFYRRTEPSE